MGTMQRPEQATKVESLPPPVVNQSVWDTSLNTLEKVRGGVAFNPYVRRRVGGSYCAEQARNTMAWWHRL